MAAWTLSALLVCVSCAAGFMSDEEIAAYQKTVGSWSLGERIAFWAEQFIGTPYDPDPLGAYVRSETVVSDDRIDCMYHVFRSVELAETGTPEEARERALDLRFRSRGVLEAGRVTNYRERFAFGEDMIESGKWGREITVPLGVTTPVAGSRGRDAVPVIAKQDISGVLGKLRSGDLVFFVKEPSKRTDGEVIGHIGIIKVEAGEVMLIHASGMKHGGGRVQKVPFSEYMEKMPFIGIRVNRME